MKVSDLMINMKRNKKFRLLGQLFLNNKIGIISTYFLFTLEILSYLLGPYLLGNAVDDLINKSYYGFIIFCSFYLVRIFVSIFRRILDTRIYTKIYTDLVTKFLSNKSIQQKDVSKLNAHSVLAKEFVNFLEYDLANVMYGLFTVIGAVIMLFFYNWYVMCICLFIFIPVILFSRFFGKRIMKLTTSYNNEFEKQVDIISSGDSNAIDNHYYSLRDLDIKKSNQDAYSFGIMEILSLIMVLASLIVLSGTSAVITAGTIIGVYEYIIRFSEGLDIIPYIIERYAQLSDITTRIEIEVENSN